MENFVYIGEQFVDRVSDSPERCAHAWNRTIQSVKTFIDPVCGESLETVLALREDETQNPTDPDFLASYFIK